MAKVKTTNKQEVFAVAIAEGKKSQRQAYIDAGYSHRGKSVAYIDKMANKVASNPTVKARIAELREEIDKKRAEKIAWDRDKAATTVMSVMSGAMKELQEEFTPSLARVVLNAVQELNELEGLYAKDKATIDKARVELEHMQGPMEVEDDGFIEALGDAAMEVWADE